MHPFYAIVVAHPAEAAQRIKAAYVKAGACQETTAEALGAGLTTFRRWVEQLGLAPALEALEAKAKDEGWHHGREGGRPRKAATTEVSDGRRRAQPGRPTGRRGRGKRAGDGRA